ncbi:hypothetical protein HYT56_01460 [Candidatus Woesearchaeota archaeon]|nr:hypothetical protein [Candidatus Woesearchaeota archaeon]
MEKKGISPIISTVLLIVLVVALTSVLVSFSRKSIEKSLEKGQESFERFSSCNEVKFFIEDAYCNPSDSGPDKIKNAILVRVRNEKNIDFKENFVVSVLFDEGSEVGTFLYGTRLNAYEVKEIGVARPEEKAEEDSEERWYREIKKIEVVPKVETSKGANFCNELKKIIEVRNCLREQVQ